ncbi:MAG: hypothetical protein GXP09_11150 [Gammaproteobacteria bacterium]|nr:hypothetical protein [Gammaproteobacteria bacterium]
MSEINTLSKSFERTLKDSNLHNVSISLAEVLTDSLMDEGVAKQIPIIGTVIGLGKTAVGIKESLFLKKIIYFISELNDISTEKRQEMINKIDTSGKFKTRVGEKLLYIIDKCDDHEESQIVACLFSAFLSGRISYDEFLRASHIISQVIFDDLRWFVEEGWKESDKWKYRYGLRDDCLTVEEAGNIASTGLVKIISPEVSVRDQDDHKMSDPYIVEGSKLCVEVSDIGKKISEILKDYFG